MNQQAKGSETSAGSELAAMIEASMVNGAEWYFTADDESGLADVLCEQHNAAFTVAMSIPVADARQMVEEQDARNKALGFRR